MWLYQSKPTLNHNISFDSDGVSEGGNSGSGDNNGDIKMPRIATLILLNIY